MKLITKKRVLAGCLAVLMLFSNATEVLASNLSEPLVEVTESVEGTETVTDTETMEETEVVEETENTEIVVEPETEQTEMTPLTSDGTIANLNYTFKDWKGNDVSTANTTENTIKLLIFDVNQTSSFTPAEALRNQSELWENLSSTKIEFVWLLYNGTTKEEFGNTSCLNHYSVFNAIKADYPEMVERFVVCLNGGNTTAGGTIEDAFYAYWDALDWTNHEANVKKDVKESDMGGHFPVVFMVNGSNEIVGIYQYNDELDYSFWTDIAEDLTQYLPCDLEAPTNVISYNDNQSFGYNKIRWNYENMDDVVDFRIYRSDDDGTTWCEEYEDAWYDDTDENGKYYYSFVDVPLDQDTGTNGVYKYKVVAVDALGLEGEPAYVYSQTGSIGMDSSETNSSGNDYTGLVFVDENGNVIDALELHVGEAKKIGLAFKDADGNIYNMTTDSALKDEHTWFDEVSNYYGSYQFDIYWKVISATGEVTNSSLNKVDYETSDVDWLLTEEVIEGKEAYFKANSLPADGTKYFVEVRVTGPITYAEFFWHRLPIHVVEAEEGVTYTQPDALAFHTTNDAMEQELRDLMTTRDYVNWVVSKDAGSYDEEAIRDIYAERDGMKPNEGDYLEYTIGNRDSISTIITDYFLAASFEYKDDDYDIWALNTPFITTAEEEKQVDDKINALMHTPGGALYDYVHGENVTDEQKIQAIYNWIVKNVSGTVPGDRRTPIYHTAYHCLIEGSGTCGAFAVLFTRMTREAGIASKVIMGTDSAAHAYNIVQLGNKWYFIDTSSSRYLADATNFSRTQEQERYLDDRFIKNYLSKVPGNTYVIENDGVAVVTDSIGTEAKTYANLEGAVSYILTQAATAGNETVEYTLTICDGNMAMPEDEANVGLDFDIYGDRVTIDLGGNTLVIPDSEYQRISWISAKLVHNGSISVGDAATVRLFVSSEVKESRYENVDFVYKSTTSGAANAPIFTTWTEGTSKIVLADSVTFEEFDTISISGNVEVNADFTAKNVRFGYFEDADADIAVNGTVTATKGCEIWSGNIDVDSLISQNATTIYDPSKATLTIGKELNLAGTTKWDDPATATKPLQVALVRQFATEDDATPTKQATINWSGSIMNGSMPLIHIVAKDYVGEAIQENTAFASGTTIGTVTAKGANSVALTSANLKDYMTVDVVEDGKSFADIEGGVLSVVSKSVTVTETSTGKNVSFSSLKKAIDGLGNIANKAAGEYTFTFSENTVLSANVTLPDYVKNAIFEAAEADIEIDFKGYTLTTKGDISVDAGVHLVNSAETNGKLVSTKSTDITDYAIGLWESVEGINLSATNGTLMLVGAENETKVITGDVTAKDIIVRNTWEVGGAITKSGLHNIGRLICDTITQTTANKTNLEANSELIVKKKADLYNVTCVESLADGQPAIYRTTNAAVSINGTFTSQSRNLIFGVLAEDDAEIDGMYDTFVDFAARQTLFATAIKNFPIEKVELLQNSDVPKYTTLLQVDGKLLVVGEWIILKAQGVDGREEIIKKFTNWKEASAYINTLSNASMTYVVEITDHLDLEEALTMPTKAAGIVFRGVSEEDELIELKYTGDLKLSTNTTFENISLGAEKYNSKTKEYEPYLSTANLSGKNLILLNSDAEFAAITGNNTSVLRVTGNDNLVTVQKSVKTLSALEVTGAAIEIGSALKLTEAAISGVKNMYLTDATLAVKSGTVATTGTLYMDNATLDANSKVEVVDIVSNSTSNRILYGGNAASNILTVKGTVTAGPDVGEDSNLPFRKAAIDITAKSLGEDGYTQGTTLLNAAKASSVWFVVGSEFAGDERTGAEYVTHKAGTVIKCGEAENANVVLYVLDAENGLIPCDSFVTLQEAFDEITRIADVTASYGIVLNADAGDAKKAITTPQKAASLVISGGDSVKTLHYSNGFTLKSDVILDNIALSPATNGTFTLGDFTLELKNCELAAGKKITSVSGSGTKKASELILNDTDLYVAGAVKAIGTLTLANAVLTTETDLTVGNVVNPAGTTGKLVGTATLTKSKDVITKVTPKITIEGNVDIVGNGVSVTLREFVNKAYSVINFAESAETSAIRANGISFAKAENLSTDSLTLSTENLGAGETGIVTKSAGYLMCNVGVEHGATITYTDADGATVVTKFVSFADAVTEINSLKTKRDYTITLYDAIASASLAAPKALTMPNKSYVNTLTIEGAGTGDYVTLYHTGNITLSTPTVIKDVLFAKTGVTAYPTAITVSTGGNALSIEGKAYFNTPITLNGGNKGTLTVTTDGQLCTLTNGVSAPTSKLEQYICGSITGFAEVNVKAGQIFTISEFGVASGTKTNYTAATFNVTTLNNAGEVNVVGTNKPGTVKITNANLNNGHVYSSGTINVTNMNMEGEVKVQAEKDFNITGKLISATDRAAFYSRQKTAKSPVPYLNISATVTLESPTDKIKVGVYDADDASKLVTLNAAPQATAQLLTASKATADMFVAEEGNVSNVGPYSALNTEGYFLMKSGSGIYAYYNQDVAVALCKGNADTGVLADADVLAYYPTFKDAVSAIEAYKDKTAEYTLILLKDVNSEDVPAAVTLPGTAGNIIITSASTEMYDLYYTGNLSLKTNTEFVRVRLSPMKSKNVGTAANIATSTFDLTLRDIAVGTLDNMALKDITGNAKQTTTIAVEGLIFTGNVMNSKELVIEKPVTIDGNVKATTVTIKNGATNKTNDLTVNGTFTTDNLVMNGYASIHATNTLTIKDIVNGQTEGLGDAQTNTIYYGVNNKNAGNLTVKGFVSGSNTNNMIFNLEVVGKSKTDYQLVQDTKSIKFILADSQKVAVVEKAALSEMDFQLNGAALEKAETVKANKGVYVINTATTSATGINSAVLEYEQNGEAVSSYCLDMTQAATEINNLNDKTAEYTIKVGMQGTDVLDTNLTDTSERSALTLPKANVAAELTIKSATSNAINFTGNISYSGNLTLERCGIIAQNISNVKELTLNGVGLTTTGTVTVPTLVLAGNVRWNALGAVTVTDLDASSMGENAYLSTKQKASGATFVPQFTIKETVTLDAENTPIPWKVFTVQAAQGNLQEVAAYKDVSLVIAAKETADKFVAYPFAEANIGTNDEGMTADNLIAYKNTKNEVKNGNKDDMVVRVVQGYEKEGVFEAVGETYAGSFDEAVTIINNLADAKASYRMELLRGGIETENVIKTTKNGTAYGAMTLPTKAAGLTIVGAVEDAPTIIFYTGTLKPSCNLTLENVALTEGTVKNGEFVPSYEITPSLSGTYTLTFADNATTVYQEGNFYADVKISSLTAAKGTVIFDNASVYVTKALNVNVLELQGESSIRTKDKATISNLLVTGSEEVDAEPVKFYAEKTTAITDITGNGTLYMENYFTTITNPTQQCATQLEIKGNIAGVELKLVPILYTMDERYHKMSVEELEAFNVTTAKPTPSQKLVTMAKASTANISVWYSDGSSELQEVTTSSLYKQDGILYLTKQPSLMKVTAQNELGVTVYEADFLSWEQAVKEIDKRADSTLDYQMILLTSVNEDTAIKTLTLPSKADEVLVTSEDGEENYVCFTGNSVSLKCDTTFEEIGLFALKKSGSVYVPTSYNISASNYVLEMADMIYEPENGKYLHTIGNITGSAKGYLEVEIGSDENNTLLVVNKISGFGTVEVYNEVRDEVVNDNQVQSVLLVQSGMTGVGMLRVHPGAIVYSEKGAISVKEVDVYGGAVMATGITVSQTATLESAMLMAGSEANNDGKMQIKDIIVQNTENYLSVEQDKNGKSQLTVSGIVKAGEAYEGSEEECAISVDLYYNNYSKHAKLCEGMVLLTAQKADAFWFAPYYTIFDAEADEVSEGMGYETEGFGVYKLKNEIRYGAVAQ